jgi:hypothetical protein
MERKPVTIKSTTAETLRPIRRIVSGYGQYVASELKLSGEPKPLGVLLKGLSENKKRKLGELLETLIKALR